MNGYTMLADSYRSAMNDGKIDKETAEKKIRVLEFLATCDEDDLCSMVDSSAFNDLIRAFLRLAVNRAELDEKSKDKVLNQLWGIFDGYTAKEVLDCE